MNIVKHRKLIVSLAIIFLVNSVVTFTSESKSDNYIIDTNPKSAVAMETNFNEDAKKITMPLLSLVNANSNENKAALKNELIAIEKVSQVLKEKISFPFDERYFTLYAFMNYTGYDAKNLNEYYYVRQELRDELNKKNIRLSDNNYYSNRSLKTMDNGKLVEEPLLHSSYVDFIHKTGLKYPSMTMTSKKIIGDIPYNNISDLAEHLDDFYKSANIASLIPKYRNYHANYIKGVEKEVYASLVNMILTYNIKDIKETTVDINLLEASERGVSYIDKDLYTNKSSIHLGPSSNPEKSSKIIVHEYLHQYVNPTVDKYDINLLVLNGEIRYPVEGIYNDKRSIVIESIVRVLDTLYEHELYSKAFKTEVDRLEMLGFAFSTETYDRLIKFDFEKGTLTEFIDELMTSYIGKDLGVASNATPIKNHPINKMRFIYDEKVFTMFAFINATGFDDIVQDEMSEVRKNIRDNICEKDAEEFKDYYLAKDMPLEDYINALDAIGPAPEFKVIGNLPENLNDLPKNLRDFSKKASVPSIYEFYKKEQESISIEYVNMSMLKLLMYDHNNFYRISFDDMQEVDVTVNLMGTFNDGYISTNMDNPMIIIGDSELENNQRNVAVLYQKYINTTINPIVSSMENEGFFSKKSKVKALEDTIAYEKHGDDSIEYIKENLMYAIRTSMIYRNSNKISYYEYSKLRGEGYMLVEGMCIRIRELNKEINYEEMIETIMDEAYN